MPQMRTAGEPLLPRKLTVRAHNRKLVLDNRAGESERHVLLKALAFALSFPTYPDIAVERTIGHRVKPDLVQLNIDGRPLFWAECGETARAKLIHLTRSLAETHLVIAMQGTSPGPGVSIVRNALPASGRGGPVELVRFPDDASRHVDEDGRVTISLADCEIVRIAPRWEGP